jgi:hypothetical protein
MDRRTKWVVGLLLAIPAGASAQEDIAIITCIPPIVGDARAVAFAAAEPSLIARGMVGSTSFDLSGCLTQRGKLLHIDATFLTALAQGTIHVTINQDPFVNFSLATTNLVAGPTFMQFTFGAPIVPGLYSSATSSLSGGLTAGVGAAAVTNVGPAPFLVGNGTVFGVPVPPSIPGNLGVDIGFGPCVTAAPPALPTSVNCPALPAAGAFAFAPTFYNDLDATVTYDQSGLLSQATFNGRVDLFSAVPEPATVSLLLAGVLALGAGAAVRRRQS